MRQIHWYSPIDRFFYFYDVNKRVSERLLGTVDLAMGQAWIDSLIRKHNRLHKEPRWKRLKVGDLTLGNYLTWMQTGEDSYDIEQPQEREYTPVPYRRGGYRLEAPISIYSIFGHKLKPWRGREGVTAQAKENTRERGWRQAAG